MHVARPTVDNRSSWRAAISLLPAPSQTALLVDDEPGSRRLAHLMLERLGYRVLTAPSASEALEIADAYWDPIDIFVLDIVMPEMTGLEVADALRVMHPEAKTLYLSAYAAAGDSVLSRGDAFLLKPSSIEQLADALAALTGEVCPTPLPAE